MKKTEKYNAHKEWLEHPETRKFLDSLKDKAQAIRFQAYLHLELPDNDKVYVELLEDIIRALGEEPIDDSPDGLAKEAAKYE